MKPYGTGTYTVTAALPYANGPIHIGHLAGAYLPADIYARYLRMRGHEVAFICGSDEGGVAILLKARKEDTTPKAIVDRYHEENKLTFQQMGISFDIYHRTSSELHHQVASDFFRLLHKEGKLLTKTSEQFYDEQEKMFLADRYLQGTCPRCAYPEAYGDQCEKCGTSFNADELIEPRSTLSNTAPARKETTHWYLPLNEYEAWLQAWIEAKKDSWRTNVYGQCISWLKAGLRPRAITRDLNWGIPLPLEGSNDKVLYVWFEAPIGYISATQAWATQVGKDWRPFWQDQKTSLVHFIGKDNIVFHCLIFPAMLKAHGDYILPTYVAGNEFMNLEGDKISTSRNHAVWIHDYLQAWPGQEDVLRYVLCANAPESRDSNFHWENFRARNNQELVAILGNFVHRVLILLHAHFDGKVPSPGDFTEEDHALIANIATLPTKIGEAIEGFKLRKAQELLMEFARHGNKYLADMAPWKTIKEDVPRTATILYVSLQIIAHIASYGSPFLPFTCQKLATMIDLPEVAWDDAYTFEKVAPDTSLDKPEQLFTKIR